MKENLIIAIDGYSSTGKSSMSKIIAKNLGYTHIDSGAMYRAVTLYAFQHQYIVDNKIDEQALITNLSDIKIEFQQDPTTQKNLTFLNGENVEADIRTMEVSKMVSPISEIPAVRDYCVALQQKMGEKGGIVMDGRDITSVVLPDAEIKIFQTADVTVRAQRRFEELSKKGFDVEFDTLYKELVDRDYRDMNREESPLIKVEDAIEIDTTYLSVDEIVALIKKYIESR